MIILKKGSDFDGVGGAGGSVVEVRHSEGRISLKSEVVLINSSEHAFGDGV